MCEIPSFMGWSRAVRIFVCFRVEDMYVRLQVVGQVPIVRGNQRKKVGGRRGRQVGKQGGKRRERQQMRGGEEMYIEERETELSSALEKSTG